MFKPIDFIIIGFIFLISILFSMLARRVFFAFSFPQTEVSSYLKTKGRNLKSYRKISSNDIPKHVIFKKQSLFYNVFLFKIIYFEIKTDHQKETDDNIFYAKYYKAGIGLLLKDKICFHIN